ncbi:hypothetical protein ES703_37029 [subsurface metagenome]
MTLYLKEEIVRQTLNTITSISPKGSIISFDYYSKSVVIGEGSWILKPGIKGLKTTGEEFSFGIDMSGDAREKAERILKECGFTLKSLTLIGKKTKKDNPFMGVVETLIE